MNQVAERQNDRNFMSYLNENETEMNFEKKFWFHPETTA